VAALRAEAGWTDAQKLTLACRFLAMDGREARCRDRMPGGMG
jgi:hypothetical protein